jgi:integrase
MACITKKRGRTVIDFYDQHGKRRLKTLPEGISKRDARKELRRIEEEVEKGTYLSRASIPGFKDLAKKWLKYKKPNIRYSTYEQYRGHVDNHLIPYFGLTPVTRINFNSIERFMADATEKDMNPATLKKLLITLGGIFRYAVVKRVCEYNPVREIEKPKASSKKKVDFLNLHEIRALLAHAERPNDKEPIPIKKKRVKGKSKFDPIASKRFMTLLTLSIMSGLRQGEALGLKWTDIDWFNCQVHVQRTFNHGRFFAPKSEASNRSVDLGPTLIKQLKEWKVMCPPNGLNLVFPNQVGKPIDSRNLFQRDFEPALRRAGLRRIRWHDLRHTYAALLIDQGEHPKYIQTQMGHSSINVTMDTYGHLMNPVNREASEKLDKAIFEGNGDIMETTTKKDSTENG